MKELLLLLLTPNSSPRLTADEIEARVRAFVIVMVTLILFFIVVTLIYSVMFVSQPIKAMAPIDQAFTKMLNDIVLLIVGGIGGVMTKGLTNEAKAMMDNVKLGASAYIGPKVETITMAAPSSGWTPPPAPKTPPVLDEEERERIANLKADLR